MKKLLHGGFRLPKNEGVAFVEQEELIAIRRQLHQIPEIGLEEKETQAFLLNEIDKMKQPYLQVRTWQTGILVFIEGKILRKPSAGVLILMVYLFKRKWFLLFNQNDQGLCMPVGTIFT